MQSKNQLEGNQFQWIRSTYGIFFNPCLNAMPEAKA